MTLEEIVNNLKSAGQDYGQLFNNNPRMDATKQFGGRAINNINSAGEGYSQWQRLQDQNFGPNQSVIASGFMHPQKGLSKLADWFTNNVNTAAGLPDPNQQDEASMYAYGPNIDQQAESGLNLAGLLQTGAFASGAAPKSAGGTLGTFIGRNSTGWDATKAAEAEKLLNAGADPAQVWKDHLIGRMPDKSLFSEISDQPLTVRVDNFSNPYGSWGIDPQKAHGLNDIQSLLDEGINEGGVHSLTGWAKHYGESLPPEGQWNPPPSSYYEEKLIEHQPLSQLYDFNKLQTRGAASESPMANGYFNGENNKIVINALTDKKQNLKNYSGARSVAAHELQHAIQEKEGWARGTSPQYINPDEFNKIRNDEYKNIINTLIPKNAEKYKNSINEIERQKIIENQSLLRDRLSEITKQDQSAIQNEIYRRHTGEAQARATQDRMNMNMQQRRDTYPLAGDKLSDIPLDQLINRYRDNGPSMSMSIKNPNLNFELLNKHLSGQKLTPEEMALYEKNGSAMETPQLQRYNLGNANAQGGSTDYLEYQQSFDSPDYYHGTGHNIPQFRPSENGRLGPGVYVTPEKETSNIFSKISGSKRSGTESNVMPLKINPANVHTYNGYEDLPLSGVNNEYFKNKGIDALSVKRGG